MAIKTIILNLPIPCQFRHKQTGSIYSILKYQSIYGVYSLDLHGYITKFNNVTQAFEYFFNDTRNWEYIMPDQKYSERSES